MPGPPDGPGVCVATSGPGATNLVTGLATAHMDSTPVVAITGQVPRAMIGRDAFQETDIIGITQPITKHSVLVEDVESWPTRSARPWRWRWRVGRGRCWWTSRRTCSRPRRSGAPGGRRPAAHRHAPRPPLAEAARLIAKAERPLIMAGHGIILSGAYEELRELAERTGIPVITTLLGISAFPNRIRCISACRACTARST